MSLLILSCSQLSLIRVNSRTYVAVISLDRQVPGAPGIRLATIWSPRIKPTRRWADKRNGEKPRTRTSLNSWIKLCQTLPISWHFHVMCQSVSPSCLTHIELVIAFQKWIRDLRLNHPSDTTCKTWGGWLWRPAGLASTTAGVLEWHGT